MANGEGSNFGKYYLVKKIASGGMGDIFLAKLRGPVGFEKLLCIKRMLAHQAENKKFIDMFFAEGRIAAELTHSNIVQIYEMGQVDDAYFIVMEYVHGKNLRDVIDRTRIKGERVPLALAIEIIGHLCVGMSYAHNANNLGGQSLSIVHRDINPQNLLISYGGDVKIIDFGIAKSEMAAQDTDSGAIKGKFVYMSPEQSAAQPLDKRSDQFSVGICLYEILTGTNPFAKSNNLKSLDAIQTFDPPPPSQTDPALALFDPILARVLAKKPTDRYHDLDDLNDELETLLRSGQLPARPTTLAAYMQDLFAPEIESEKKFLMQTLPPAPVAAPTRVDASVLASSGSRRPEPIQDEPTHTEAIEIMPVRQVHSRRPFAMGLVLIVLFTIVGTLAVLLFAPERRLNVVRTSVIMETRRADSVRAVDPTPIATPPPAPAPVVAAPTPAPEPEERRPRPTPPPVKPANPGFGSLQMSTNPPVSIALGSATVGQTLKLRGAGGTLTFGAGAEAKNDPFKVTVTYRVEGARIEYNVDAQPWAIVRGKGGIGLGKTPLGPVSGEGQQVFELANPKEQRALRITLRYVPPT